jgi:ankyrin repeat protein
MMLAFLRRRKTKRIGLELMKRIGRELIEAARENNLPEVRRLLSIGANVNAQGSGGVTPLHRVSWSGHVPVVKELLGHGADIEAKAHLNMTPLHFACKKGHLGVVNELLSPSESNGTTSILGKRKSRGADTEAKDRNGSTPLHLASIGGHLAVVKALVSGGADILATNNHGDLPIHQAVRRGISEASKYLLQHYYATTRRLPLHKLVEDLAWIGNPDSRVAPPLRYALHRNGLGMHDVVEILENLVERNPELVSSRDHDGLLPLHVACRRGASFSVVQSLVNHYQASVKTVTPDF